MPEQAPPASEEISLPFGGLNRERDQGRLVVLLGSLLAAALVLIATTIYIASLRQDTTQRANEEQIVRANLTVLERTIAGNLADYANWDDAVEHLALEFDLPWARRNIGPTIHDTLGYAVALLLDPEDRPIYGQVDGEEDAEGAAATLGEAGILLANRARAATAPASRSVAAVIGGAEGYLVAAASTIRPEEESSLAMPPGKPFVLLFAKRLDARFLDIFANDFGLAHIALARTDQPDTDLASVDLIGPGGNSIARLVWTPWQPGRNQLMWLLPALLGTLLTVVIFASLALHGLRLARALRASELRLRDFAEASSDWWWETDTQGRFIWFSRSFSRNTDVDPEQLDRPHPGRPVRCPPWRRGLGGACSRSRRAQAVPGFHLYPAQRLRRAADHADKRPAGGRSGRCVPRLSRRGSRDHRRMGSGPALAGKRAAVPLPGREHARHHFLPRRGRRWPSRL